MIFTFNLHFHCIIHKKYHNLKFNLKIFSQGFLYYINLYCIILEAISGTILGASIEFGRASNKFLSFNKSNGFISGGLSLLTPPQSPEDCGTK